MVTIPYNNTDFAFTLNDVFILFSTALEDTYFTLKLTVKYYDFNSDVQKTAVSEHKIYLFSKASEMNIGRIVHRTMSSISELSDNEFQYKTALVDLEIKEINIADYSEVATISLNEIKFIRGILPEVKYNNFALLDTNKFPGRITNQGSVNLNYLIPEGIHKLEVYKNNELQTSTDITGTLTNNVFTKVFTAADLGAVKGDVFSFKIKDTLIKKEIVIFPDTEFSNLILFENKFNLISSFEFTGAYSMPVKYSRIKTTYKRRLVAVEEIVKATKSNKLKINTGWVLGTDNITLDEINEVKRAWMYINDTEVMELTPATTKLTLINSDEELKQYALEFNINRSSDAQNYTF